MKKNDLGHRKKDHIALAFDARVGPEMADPRFYYEPITDEVTTKPPFKDLIFNGRLRHPLWISSMTGGLEMGRHININLAKVAAKYKLGMGLGSCRPILDSNDRFEDFDIRKHIDSQPLFANLGIAQIATFWQDNNFRPIQELIRKLEADGLIIHINPLQEFTQPEGDPIVNNPLSVIEWTLDNANFDLIVKEVGQGMGPVSLRKLMSLPLKAIDTASSGGTNFALLELLRSNETTADALGSLARIGHTSEEMVGFINDILASWEQNGKTSCNRFIISGGVTSFLDGYYLLSKLNAPAIYGQASSLLKYAKESYDLLDQYVGLQLEGYELASKFLHLKS